ncbi:MAG: MBL fold metallo-hydrolase [Myxococcaceae bacterium]|nr:MBL fold metallo-hydrolase [Myxococcaceae bacterium]
MNGTKAEGLYVRQLELGPMKNFVYLVGAQESAEVVVVDPAWDVAAICRAAEADGKRLSAVFLTHHHFDHLNGVPELLRTDDVPVYAQRAEVDFAEAVQKFGSAVKPVGPGDTFRVGAAELTCVHTPGHTPGSQCLLTRNALVSGDTVFVNACGRCDLSGGDAAQMYDSLHRVLGALPGETLLYPGHDYGDVRVSSLERERRHNPYFQLAQLEAFVAHRNRPRG